jgi:hypothetical protein
MNVKLFTKWLFGLALVLLLAGQAHAQPFPYSVSASPLVCASASGNSSVTLVDTGGQTFTANCGTDVLLLNMFTNSTSAAPELVGPCNYTATLTLDCGTITYSGTISGTVSSTTANVSVTVDSVNGGAPNAEQVFVCGCTRYHVTLGSITNPGPQTDPRRGAINVHVTCDTCTTTLTKGTVNPCYGSANDFVAAALAATTSTNSCGSPVNLTAGPVTGTCPASVTISANCASTPVTYTANIITAPPTFDNCPSDTGVQCLSSLPPAATVTAHDSCGNPLVVTPHESQSNPGSSCHNVVTRTWTATDCLGQQVTCTQTITVNDTTAPNIVNCPVGPITVTGSAASNCTTASVPLNISATDNCDLNPTVTISVQLPGGGAPVALSTLADPANPGSFLFPVGTSTVTVTAVDACNNAATPCTFTVTVNPCPGGATRTLGFWSTHVNALQTAITNGCFANVTFCGSPATINELEAIFFAQIGQSCTGKRSALGQARLQLGQQLLAAYANCCVLGTCPTTFSLSDALAALNGTDINAILTFANLADQFNNSGDAIDLNAGQLTAVGPANPKLAKSLANSTNGCIDPGSCFQ